jgi:hypothetical protein
LLSKNQSKRRCRAEDLAKRRTSEARSPRLAPAL